MLQLPFSDEAPSYEEGRTLLDGRVLDNEGKVAGTNDYSDRGGLASANGNKRPEDDLLIGGERIEEE